MSLRTGGVSCGPWASLNLGAHTADSAASVAVNRERFMVQIQAPTMPVFLRQVHGCDVVFRHALREAKLPPVAADAQITTSSGLPLAVMAADCLPVLFCDSQGEAIATAHAGWRGLKDGVLRRTVQEMRAILPAARKILAWVGPGIGRCHFEVGDDVRASFVAKNPRWASFFTPIATGLNRHTDKSIRYFGDLAGMASLQLESLAVDVEVDDRCTHCCEAEFFSHRRDSETGRMAAVIWRE